YASYATNISTNWTALTVNAYNLTWNYNYSDNYTLDTFNAYNSTWDNSWVNQYAYNHSSLTNLQNVLGVNVSQNWTEITRAAYDTRWIDTYNATYASYATNISTNWTALTVNAYNLTWNYNYSFNYTSATVSAYNATWDNSWVNQYAYNHSSLTNLQNVLGTNVSRNWTALTTLQNVLGVNVSQNWTEITRAAYDTRWIDTANSSLLSINQTKNIQALYNLTAGMIANMSILQSGNFTTGNLGTMYNYTVGLIANMSISQSTSGVNYWGSNGSNIYNLTAYIGIGTSSPAYNLHVNGTFASGTAPFFVLTNTGRVLGNLIFNNMTNDSDSGIVRGRGTGGLDFLYFGGGWFTGMTLDNAGKVGIGTTGPGELLHIYNTNASLNALSNIALETAGGGSKALIGAIANSVSAGDRKTSLYFSTYDQATGGTAERVRIDNLGNVGIGNSTPTAKLHVQNGAVRNPNAYSNLVVEANDYNYLQLLFPASREGGILFGDEAAANSGQIIYTHASDSMTFSTATMTAMTLIGGKVGIGSMNNPSDPLSVGGNANFTGNLSIGSGDQGTIESNTTCVIIKGKTSTLEIC
ncbi:MAG: hypothetical protein NTU63_00790, partial [Candidatus Pacearchaeota archaeon]|nr:hypothetical protein [Candidatus Pacearchaeota archaeon]